MPQVGKQKFPYTSKGKKAAKSYAKETGQEIESYQQGGAVRPPKSANFLQRSSAVEDAQKMGQELTSVSLEDIPTINAIERKQVSPIGKEVGTGVYKDGGFIKKAIEKHKSKKERKKEITWL